MSLAVPVGFAVIKKGWPFGIRVEGPNGNQSAGEASYSVQEHP